MFLVRFDPMAKQELAESIDWYKTRQAELGTRFYKAVSNTVEQIANHPFLFAVRYRSVRTAPVANFPFTIHYSIDETKHCVAVHAIMHTSRNPQIAENRTAEA